MKHCVFTLFCSFFFAPFTFFAEEKKSLTDIYKDAARVLCEYNLSNRAVYYTEEALHHEPQNLYTIFNHANTLNMANFNEESLTLYYKLLYYAPTNPSFLYNTAYTLNRLYELDKALLLYDATLHHHPGYVEAQFSRGLTHLFRGDFKEGWRDYELRFSHGEYSLKRREYTQPLWTGQVVSGDIVYLYGEQAHGDIIQFIRFAQIAKDRGATVYASVHESLVPLLSLCPYLDCVINMNQYPSHFSYHAPLMSLPYLLSLEGKDLATTIPYLSAKPDLIEYWQEKTDLDTNLKVGICFRGSNNYTTACLRAAVQSKSISLDRFAPLAAIPGVTLYCLHRKSGMEKFDTCDQFPLVTFDNEDFDDTHGRFMDTAALIANMDVVVSIDTSLCHLAGALGIPTLLLLPTPADFRWGKEPCTTVWYPQIMTLFRQTAPEDWSTPLQKVYHELKKRARLKNPHLYDSSIPAPVMPSKNASPAGAGSAGVRFATMDKPVCTTPHDLVQKITCLEREILSFKARYDAMQNAAQRKLLP